MLFLACAALQSGVAERKALVVAPRTKLIPWPGVRATAAQRALDRKTWRDAVENLVPLRFKKPQQVGRMTRSCSRHGGSGLGQGNGALCNDCDLGAEDVEVLAFRKADGTVTVTVAVAVAVTVTVQSSWQGRMAGTHGGDPWQGPAHRLALATVNGAACEQGK
eukprot:366442-Chlamydomonas_euryale.AAC.29